MDSVNKVMSRQEFCRTFMCWQSTPWLIKSELEFI